MDRCARRGGRRRGVARLPSEGTALENLQYLRRQNRVAQRKLPLTWPQMTKDDEFPLVPFLFGPDGENIYDSTAIAVWFDRGLRPDRRTVPEEPIAGFVTRLI